MTELLVRPSPSEAGDRPDPRSRRWPSLLFAILLLLLATAALGLAGNAGEGRLADTDAYSFANRVTDLRLFGDWFDDTVERINPPIGHKQHWSRPFDSLLLVGALVGEPFIGFSDALIAWAIILPCLLGAATVAVLWWGFSDLPSAAGLEAMALLVGAQPAIIQGFQAGRADHQVLIGALIVLAVATARRASRSKHELAWSITAGSVSALGLWVGMEFVLVVAGLFVALAVEWIIRGGDVLRRLRTYSASLGVFAAFALLAENGPSGVLQTELDELSIVWVLFALLGAGASELLRRASDGLPRPRDRALGLLVTAVACGAALVMVFPSLLSGPLGDTDPLYAQTRLRNIIELQPVLGESIPDTLQRFAVGLSLLPFAVYGLFSHLSRYGSLLSRGMHLIVIPAIVYLPLAVAQQRWLLPLNLLLVVPAALGVQRLMRRATAGVDRLHLGTLSIAAATALWWFPIVLLTGVEEPPARCDVNQAVQALNDEGLVGSEPSRVMAMTDLGPELLFRTPHHVMSIPNHRFQAGYTATWEAMTTHDSSHARQILTDHDVDLVLVCADAVEASFYGDDAQSFHRRLVSGDAPPWMRDIPVSSVTGMPSFHLYEVAELPRSG